MLSEPRSPRRWICVASFSVHAPLSLLALLLGAGRADNPNLDRPQGFMRRTHHG